MQSLRSSRPLKRETTECTPQFHAAHTRHASRRKPNRSDRGDGGDRGVRMGMPTPSGDELQPRHRDLFWHAASKGVTLLHDCGIGTLGGAADLVLLEDDPTTVDPSTIASIEVSETRLSGEVRYTT